jgi:hypothetical protein
LKGDWFYQLFTYPAIARDNDLKLVNIVEVRVYAGASIRAFDKKALRAIDDLTRCAYIIPPSANAVFPLNLNHAGFTVAHHLHRFALSVT